MLSCSRSTSRAVPSKVELEVFVSVHSMITPSLRWDGGVTIAGEIV